MTATETAGIVRDPEVMSGTPVFVGTRIPIKTLFDYLKGGDSLDEFLENYPAITHAQAHAVLDHAQALLLADA